jgi:hypothetical protein
MPPPFYDPASMHHQNLISINNSAQAMSDHNHRSPLAQFFERTPYLAFSHRIDLTPRSPTRVL